MYCSSRCRSPCSGIPQRVEPRRVESRRHRALRHTARTVKGARAMTLLILGLLIFLGSHSVRIFAESWRGTRIAAMGLNAWKGVYSVVA
ncbi:MAG: NnrU family protein, partial [Betaproteobacteria bacterium]